MNGELIDFVQIASNAKSYMRGKDSDYKIPQYTEDVRFFVKGEPTFIEKLVKGKDQKFTEVASTVNEWFMYLKNGSTKDVFLSLGKVEEQDVNLSAFANGVPKWSILTKNDKGSIIAWYRKWYSDEYLNKWHVELYGLPSRISNKGIIQSMEGVEEEMISSLTDIIELARNINEESWAKFFERARKNLECHEDIISSRISRSYPELNHRLIETVSIGWCFGGMGSWNDSPPYSAHALGLDEEFKRITEKLYSTYLNTIEATVNVF